MLFRSPHSQEKPPNIAVLVRCPGHQRFRYVDPSPPIPPVFVGEAPSEVQLPRSSDNRFFHRKSAWAPLFATSDDGPLALKQPVATAPKRSAVQPEPAELPRRTLQAIPGTNCSELATNWQKEDTGSQH